MARRVCIVLMTTIVMASIAAPSARAQTLADAARRAAEERQRAAGSDVTLALEEQVAHQTGTRN